MSKLAISDLKKDIGALAFTNLAAVPSAEPVVTLFGTADVMAVMQPLPVKLQDREQDLAQAVSPVHVAIPPSQTVTYKA